MPTRLSDTHEESQVIPCVRGSPIVPMVGCIFFFCIFTSLNTNGAIRKNGADGKKLKMLIPLVQMVQVLPTNGTIGGHAHCNSKSVSLPHTKS